MSVGQYGPASAREEAIGGPWKAVAKVIPMPHTELETSLCFQDVRSVFPG